MTDGIDSAPKSALSSHEAIGSIDLLENKDAFAVETYVSILELTDACEMLHEVDLFEEEREAYIERTKDLGRSRKKRDQVELSEIAGQFLKPVFKRLKGSVIRSEIASEKYDTRIADYADTTQGQLDRVRDCVQYLRATINNLGSKRDAEFVFQLFSEHLAVYRVDPEPGDLAGVRLGQGTYYGADYHEITDELRFSKLRLPKRKRAQLEEYEKIAHRMFHVDKGVAGVVERFSAGLQKASKSRQEMIEMLPDFSEIFIERIMANYENGDEGLYEEVNYMISRLSAYLDDDSDAMQNLTTLSDILSPEFEIETANDGTENEEAEEVEVASVTLSEEDERFLTLFVNGKAKGLSKMFGADVKTVKSIGDRLHRLGFDPLEVGLVVSADCDALDLIKNIVPKASQIKDFYKLGERVDSTIAGILDGLENIDFRNKLEAQMGSEFVASLKASFGGYLEQESKQARVEG